MKHLVDQGKRRAVSFVLAVCCVVFVSCSHAGGVADSGDTTTDTPTTIDPIKIFSTTGHIGDAVAHIAPNAKNIVWVGPGGDPHTQQASTRDVEQILSADLVLWNGLQLEAQIQDQLYSLGDKQLALGEQLPENLLLPWPGMGAGEPVYDPHVWNNPNAWILVVEAIADKLADIDPENAEEYVANAAEYTAQITSVHEDITQLIATVPAEQRTLITGHDAFNYFGSTYDFTVLATDYVSSEATMSSPELSRLVDLIVERNIPTIFVDNLKNDQAIVGIQEAVAQRGGLVQVSDAELFADSLGAQAPVNTYLGALRHNAETIAEGLGAE